MIHFTNGGGLNATNKIVYGSRVLYNVQKQDLTCKEICSKKNHLTNDGTLVKVLFYDIVRQTRLLAGMSSVDAENCYDQITHLITS